MMKRCLAAGLLAFSSPALAVDDLAPADTAFKQQAEIGLTRLQVRNLALLAKVWGFTKYHHPVATSGQRDWDAELFALLGPVTSARSTNDAIETLNRWVDALGPVAICDPCARVSEDLDLLSPTPMWLESGELFETLAQRLRHIYDNRSIADAIHYLQTAEGVGNPVFTNETGADDAASPEDPQQRMLALFRYWNAVRYWFPYRDLMARNWDHVLAEAIPKFAYADDVASYRWALVGLVKELGDSHSMLLPPAAKPEPGDRNAPPKTPVENCRLPYELRFLGERLTVTRYQGAMDKPPGPLRPGDVILAIDGAPVPELQERISRYRAASNRHAQMNNLVPTLGWGACENVTISVDRQGRPEEIAVSRLPLDQLTGLHATTTHDRDGDTFQMLDDIAYIKLSSISREDVPAYMESAAKAAGLIIDIRNYPSDFVPFDIGKYLATEPSPFVTFTLPDVDTPGAFEWGNTLAIYPVEAAQRVTVPVMVLIDGISMSRAEYTAMAFRATGAILVGGTTVGADGNVSYLQLPTGERAMFTGIGVFYPDRGLTQRIGIIPDIYVEPTPKGLVEGRDEVLEAAIAAIREARS